MNSPSPYYQPGGYGSSFDTFGNDYWTKIAWGAVFGLFILWGLSWFMRHAFGQADEPGLQTGAGPYGNKGVHRGGVDPEIQQTGAGVPGTTAAGTTGTGVGGLGTNTAGTTTAGTTTGDTAYTTQPGRLGGGGLFDVYTRTHRTSEVLRDLLLMLLTVMVLNTVARGITRAAAIIAWIFFAFAVLFAIFEGAYAHRFGRLFYSIIFFGLALAIGACAFRYGF
ncbi:hypothetical protein INT43_000731 [Umbelopsis isabellina]|uniref:Uncharacterized protein n=1 Tax=Mortierella isabellina TaxID=91625 RepID=A0A8H7Q2P5_MORIS|nr:hypothetical protein INT43_000731 [Umbelopsis isabellina]